MKDVMVGSVGTQQGDTYVGNAAALDCDSSVVNVNVTPSAVKNTSVRPTLAAFFLKCEIPPCLRLLSPRSQRQCNQMFRGE